MDEWDAIFQMDFMNDVSRKKYLSLLKGILKDKAYVELAYMTGVLPIAKYSSGSELNMFGEYNFINDTQFSDYFGFTEKEVKTLCQEHDMSFEQISDWYNGYYDYAGNRIYNPRSVSMALQNHSCQSYWTQTGPMDEISWYIQHNTLAVRDDVIKMISGQKITIRFRKYFTATSMYLNTRDEILNAMVIYGFLSYYNGKLSIPNKELMLKFEDTVASSDFPETERIIRRSDEMLEATWNLDEETMAKIIEECHDSEISSFRYNDENSLSCVINFVYLNARDMYRIEREEFAGKGRADFIFRPKKENIPAIVLELKVDDTPENTLNQIKEKNYMDKVKECAEILLVGIAYSKKDKKHHILIEKDRIS